MEVELPTKVDDMRRPRGRDRAKSSLDVVRDPLNEVGGILVLDIAHLLVDFLHRDSATA